MDDSIRKNREGLITLVPTGTIAQRIRVIASMIQVAERYQRPMEIIWFTNEMLPCDSDRLFTLSPQLNQEGITIRQASWVDYILNVPPSNNNLYISLPFVLGRYDRIINEKRLSELLLEEHTTLENILQRDKEKILISTSIHPKSYPNMYITLEATVEVNNVRRSRMSGWGENIVGIHINRKNNYSSIHESPTELFIKRMQNMIEEDPTVQFFIATDSNDEKERLFTIFHDRIFIPYSTTDIWSIKGTIQELGELLALSYTSLILTTPGSAFSEVAAEIREIPIESISIFASNTII